MSKPLVSVFCITYNHEKFVSDAIDGFLMQKCSFPLEIVIRDDCSSDKTCEIISTYQKRFPDLISFVRRKKNIGMMKNFTKTLGECKGKYIALCEGDDYWTDPYKLQKQVDFLEKHPEYSITTHNVEVVTEGKGCVKTEWLGKNHKSTLEIEDILRDGSGGATCSIMYRNKVFGDFPKWYMHIYGGDWTLQILCTKFGKLKYFPELMGVYRRHKNGSLLAAQERELSKGNIDIIGLPQKYCLEAIDILDTHFTHKYHALLMPQKLDRLLELVRAYSPYSFSKAYYSLFSVIRCIYDEKIQLSRPQFINLCKSINPLPFLLHKIVAIKKRLI